jgi:hypothetical protein
MIESIEELSNLMYQTLRTLQFISTLTEISLFISGISIFLLGYYFLRQKRDFGLFLLVTGSTVTILSVINLLYTI